MGPFFIAWVDSSETTFGQEHVRVDEDIRSLKVTHSEGDFAQLEVVIRNPKVGLLKASRKTWAWFSYDPFWRENVPYQLGAESASDEGGSGSFPFFSGESSQEINLNAAAVIPLFFGRITAVPTNINEELITLIFSARPADYVTRKIAAAEPLRVLPMFDPIFIDKSEVDNPDSVLEGYSALWHIDRLTHDVTASDITTGEDGTEAFSADEVPYDSVKINLGQTPLNTVYVDASVSWNQTATGKIPNFIKRNFDTYSGQSFISDWPVKGANLGGGWFVDTSSIEDLYDVSNVKVTNWSYEWKNTEEEHANGDYMTVSNSESSPNVKGPYKQNTVTSSFQVGVVDPYSDPPVNRPAKTDSTTFYVVQSRLLCSLGLRYEAKRARTEHVTFTLNADVQPLVTNADGDDVTTLKITGRNVSNPISFENSSTPDLSSSLIPIDDVSRASYFTTDRGLQSIEYLLARARAVLMLRARAVEVSWDCTFERAIRLSCRMNASITDDRLPGGGASGKIIEYTFGVDGDSGEWKGSVKIGCSVGRDGTISAVAGTPDYVDDGYVDTGYQTYTGQTIVASLGDSSVGYAPPTDLPNDDGLTFPLAKDTAGTEVWTGSISAQEDAILASFADGPRWNTAITPASSISTQQTESSTQDEKTAAALEANPIWCELTLNPLDGGPYNTDYTLTVSVLKIPKTMDLEA